MGHVFSRGVEAAVDAKTGRMSRSQCTHVVVYQPEEGDEPLPMMHAANEQDAREYVAAMKASGAGRGLRVVKADKDLV